jgi:ribosomal protein L17
MATDGEDDVRARREEAERYRLAAEEALEQLDWCVNYLYRIRKGGIARVIEKNRREIRKELSR